MCCMIHPAVDAVDDPQSVVKEANDVPLEGGDEESLEDPIENIYPYGECDGLYFKTLIERYPSLQKQLLLYRNTHVNMIDPDMILQPWQLEKLGIQAVTEIARSDTPFETLLKISADFPEMAVRLSDTRIPSGITAAVRALHSRANAGSGLISVNGNTIPPQNMLTFFPFLKNVISPVVNACELLMRSQIPMDVASEAIQHLNEPPTNAISIPNRLDVMPSLSLYRMLLDFTAPRKSIEGWRKDIQYIFTPLYDVLTHPPARAWMPMHHYVMYGRGSGQGNDIPAVRYHLATILIIYDPSSPAHHNALISTVEAEGPVKVYGMPFVGTDAGCMIRWMRGV
eukprot:GHVO01050077.1.p1 GENE.GHVO01050077.1~~GHVO01050077.1.p1  ORF type:complete len:340 (+),score=66.22 GHVO01050077.1:450-1469(+)